jgi:O-phosphoseryl-tRNA(Cys) synthetase
MPPLCAAEELHRIWPSSHTFTIKEHNKMKTGWQIADPSSQKKKDSKLQLFPIWT